MGTIEFVKELINLWNENHTEKFQRTWEGFKDYITNQTVQVHDGHTLYSLEDVLRFLEGKEVED